MHYISLEALTEVVLNDIRKHAVKAKLEPDKLLEQLSETNDVKSNRDLIQLEKELSKAEKRIAELKLIFKRLYEDNVTGKLSDERFNELSQEYEAEQNVLKSSIENINRKLTTFGTQKNNSERFAKIAEKYCTITELNTAILNELIDKIVIHEAKYPDDGKDYHGCRENRRHRTQQIDIYYNFVGTI